MSKADDDYAEAERLIAAARDSGSDTLSLSHLPYLSHLPPAIATLLELRTLDVMHTEVTDLTPLAPLAPLTALDLSDTQVSDLTPLTPLTALTALNLKRTQAADLTPLAALTALTTLDLGSTKVSDLTPLTPLTALTALNLERTQVADLTPLAALTALTALDLGGTQVTALIPLAALTDLATLYLWGTRVTDLTPLAPLTALTALDLGYTPVTDLTPLAALTALRRLDLSGTEVTRDSLRALAPLQRLIFDPEGPKRLAPDLHGLFFPDTAADKSDPRIAEIAKIGDPSTRARALFDHLGMPVDHSTAPSADPTPPPRRPAPLEITVTDTDIRMAGPEALPESGANDRAAMGWQALHDYRRNFARAFHVGNYQPLPSYLEDFDAAMGTAYDPRHVIRIGVEGLRLSALSRNGTFTATLPVGADSDLAAFVATIDLYVRRFPDWVAYNEDADPDDVSPQAIKAAASDFRAIDHVIQTTPEAEDAVKAEYRAEVTTATGENADPPAAQAITASTGEFARALAEHGSAEVDRKNRNAALARKGGDLYDKTVLAPIGISLHVMQRLEGPMRSLSKRFPNRMGWIDAWYDATFPAREPPPIPNNPLITPS